MGRHRTVSNPYSHVSIFICKDSEKAMEPLSQSYSLGPLPESEVILIGSRTDAHD